MEKKNIGQLEYRLHKDGSWVADLFETSDEMKRIIKELKQNKYKYTIKLFNL